MFSKSASPDTRLARYDHLIVHVTATPPDRDLDDRDIDRMHRNRGFSGCGYNALIKRDGTWLDSDMGAVTRPLGRAGAHVGGCGAGWNGRSFGVSLVGGVDDAIRPDFNMTDEQMLTLERGIKKFLSVHPNGNGVTVMGHRDLIAKTNAPNKKACPCFDTIPWWQARADTGVPTIDEDEDKDLVIPGGSPVDQPRFWTVASGDTLSKIVGISGVSMSTILSLNPDITDPNLIGVGDVIRLSAG